MIIILSIFLVISLSINFVMAWYVKKIMNNFVNTLDSIDNLKEVIEIYSESVESVSKLQEFYGDDIIKQLVLKTKTLIKDLEAFQERVIDENGTKEKEENSRTE